MGRRRTVFLCSPTHSVGNRAVSHPTTPPASVIVSIPRHADRKKRRTRYRARPLSGQSGRPAHTGRPLLWWRSVSENRREGALIAELYTHMEPINLGDIV